jgi:hypothetical protein
MEGVVKEVVLPNKFNNLCRLLKKDLRTKNFIRVLCKFESLMGINYFIIGNGRFLACWPFLVEDNTIEGPYDFEYVKVNKYHGKFILRLNTTGFNYPVINFFNKEIVKSMEFDLGYKKEFFIYHFIKEFDNLFDLRIVDIIYEIFESKKIAIYQLDGDIFMVTESINRDIDPFQACTTRLFFVGMK